MLSRMILAGSFFIGFFVMSTVAAAQQDVMVPMISFNQSHPLVNQNNPKPMVQVYSTGRVVVYRGPGTRNPGEYEFNLDAEALSEITVLAQIVDPADVDQMRFASADESAGTFTISSDPTTSIFRFNRISGASILSAGDGSSTDVMQIVELEDVELIASSADTAAPVVSLKALHEKMIELFSRAGAQ